MSPRGNPGVPKSDERNEKHAETLAAKADIRAAARRSAAVKLKEVGNLLSYEQDPKLLAEIVTDLVGVVQKLVTADEANQR